MAHKDGVPIQFIEFVPKKGFTVTKEAAEFLTQLDSEPLGVVAIAGKYRTGKSFFVNRILLDQKQGGFGVGSTIKACTKGLWLWKQTISSDNPDHPNLRLLVIDTEGFGGIEENQNHDSKIFLLAVLLSSYFIYNSMGTIDENALQSLHLVVNMAKEVKINEDGGDLTEEDIAMNFPAFMWIVRDFSLKLVTNDGKKLSSAEYLENCLLPLKGVSETAESKNKIRRMLKYFFQDRDCVTVVRPAENEEEIQNLNEADGYMFRKEFMDQMLRVKAKIFKKVRPKRFNGKYLSGPMLLELAKSYAEALNSGKAPNIQGAWNYLVESENQRAVDEAVQGTERLLAGITDESFFKSKDWREALKQRALEGFGAKALGDAEDTQKYVAAMSEELDRKIEVVYKRRMAAQKENIKKWIFEKGSDLMSRLKENKVASFRDCEQELARVEAEFRSEYDHLPAEFVDNLVNEFRAEKQKEMFSWVQMEAASQQKREKLALEMRVRQAQEEKERQAKVNELKVQDMKERLGGLEKAHLESASKLESAVSLAEQHRTKLEEAERKFKLVERLAKDKERAARQELVQSTEKLTRELDGLRQSFFLERAELEKRISLLEQELKFKNKEIGELHAQLEYEREDKRRLQHDAETLKEKLERRPEVGRDEMIVKQEVYANMEKALSSQLEAIRELEKAVSSETLGRQLAETKAQSSEKQVVQSKAASEAIIENLKQQLRSEDLNRSEISQLTKLNEKQVESKVRQLEADLDRLKVFKFIMKYAQTIQCGICSKVFSPFIFVEHVLSELPAEQNPFRENELSILRDLEDRDEPQKLNAITVTISTAGIHEDPSKPGHQFLVFPVQVKTDSYQWTVAKKYRDFYELNTKLLAHFSWVKFPATSQRLVGGKDALTKLLVSRDFPVLEERRTELQNFLRDLLKLESVCESRQLRDFLEIDRYYDSKNFLRVNRTVKEEAKSDSFTRRAAYPARRSAAPPEPDDGMTPEERQKFFLRKLTNDR